MRLSVPEITTTAPESSRHKTSRRASFSGVQEIHQPRVRFTRQTIQVPSLSVVTRQSSVSNTQIQVSVLKQARSRSDTILGDQHQLLQQQPPSVRRGSIAPRNRSNSVFTKGLGLPAIGLLRGRRRSRVLSAREIKIFQVCGTIYLVT